MKLKLVAAVALLSLPASAKAQRGSYVMTLGADTVQVESFQQAGGQIRGLVVTRSPQVTVMRYTIDLDRDGRIRRHEFATTRADGTPLNQNAGSTILEYVGDSILRQATDRGERVNQRIYAPNGGYALGTIPLSSSFVVFGLALQKARLTPLADQPALFRLFGPNPSGTRVLYAAPDSVEVDYFGQGRFGMKFDAKGQLIRSDWRGTTYKTLIGLVPHVDAEATLQRWAAEEASGKVFGRLSTRDSSVTTVGNAHFSLSYSRPAKRGRVIWGEVVPWNAVWRLGADFATEFGTDVDVLIGGVAVPAGTYTLWMLPSESTPLLIINKRTKIFGTQYSAATDLVRIPLERSVLATPVERLALSIRDNRLWIEWDRSAYSIALVPKS